jgi:hypothetical protein
MSKRPKSTRQSARSERQAPKRRDAEPRRERQVESAGSPEAAALAHPPARNLSLLAVSIILFAAWFIFLLVTALAG